MHNKKKLTYRFVSNEKKLSCNVNTTSCSVEKAYHNKEGNLLPEEVTRNLNYQMNKPHQEMTVNKFTLRNDICTLSNVKFTLCNGKNCIKQ